MKEVKPLSTAGYTVKQIADVVKRSRKANINSLRHRQEYGSKKCSRQPASNNTINISEVRRICGSGASESTMCRIPNKCLNIVQSRMKKFPQLIQGDKHKRVRWSRMFMGCDWGKVIFSDKMKFNLGRPDGRHSYWSDLAFSSVVLANLAFVSKKMNSMVYQDVLGHRLVLYIECFPITSFTFQQDNATIRASRSTKTCWRTMTWPL
uniref:DDE_Tnp_1_7 domain-containing protein n=1 Tax=Heterorhabditis bacteriophora TaxID=37862 RepID=A0A1I7WV67_HETBA